MSALNLPDPPAVFVPGPRTRNEVVAALAEILAWLEDIQDCRVTDDQLAAGRADLHSYIEAISPRSLDLTIPASPESQPLPEEGER